MTINLGVDVDIVYKVEGTFGLNAGPSGGQNVRRVSSSLGLAKTAYQSNEVNQHLQIADLRHGMRSGAGDIVGELSPGTYWDWFEAITRGTDVAGLSKSQAEFTSMAADSATSTFTVGGSTWIAQGFRVGDVISFTLLSAAGNNGPNYTILSLAGVAATVTPAPTTMGADVTFTVVTKRKVVPPATRASRIFRSFNIEQYLATIDFSELVLGARVGRIVTDLPPTGLATMTATWLAQDAQILAPAASPNFTAPTAPTTTGLLAAVNGALRVNGVNLATVTALSFTFDIGVSNLPVVGRNTSPDVFQSRLIVTGQLSALVEDSTLLSAFDAETTFEIFARLETSTATPPADFIAWYFPKCKFMGSTKDIRNEGGVIINQPFQAMYLLADATHDGGSFTMQDSQAV